MSTSSMRVEVAEGLARLTFTQAERGNPIDGPFCAEFGAMADELSSRSDVRAVLLRAEGKAFSFGGDIGAFVADVARLSRIVTLNNLSIQPQPQRDGVLAMEATAKTFRYLDASEVAAQRQVAAAAAAKAAKK